MTHQTKGSDYAVQTINHRVSGSFCAFTVLRGSFLCNFFLTLC